MIDESLTAGMAEWVAGHVLRHHLGMDAHVLGQDGVWRNGIIPPLARERSVGVLGMGALGTASARMLAGIGFRVNGWSRRLREVDGIVTRSGPEGFREVLAASEILVLLLPSTPETASVMDAAAFASLPLGAVVINPGRGALIDDAALLAALESGHLAHATLDVFREEPLPPEHPFWAHPRVTVTPHIASETRPETASEAIARNIRRGEDGEAFVGLVDQAEGY
jgi:glyoxylate/hydroxypyruvate reductase A